MIYAIALIVLQTCQPAPDLAALFVPAHPELGRYEVCVTDETIDQAVVDGGPGSPEGLHYSSPEAVEALDAFGAAGSYDRSKLSQLYGGSRPRVARGWRQDGEHFESITLISPYPDAALGRLHPGTLVIRWII